MFYSLKQLIRQLLLSIASSSLTSVKYRLMIYKLLGMKLGEGVFIEPDVSFYNTDLSKIRLGDRVYINHHVVFDNFASIVIDADVAIGMGTKLITSTHYFGPETRRGGRGYKLPVTIGRGCWIGASAVILPGVVIGDGSIVGAGAVVNQMIEENGLYVGVPAKRVRDLVVEEEFVTL